MQTRLENACVPEALENPIKHKEVTSFVTIH